MFYNRITNRIGICITWTCIRVNLDLLVPERSTLYDIFPHTQSSLRVTCIDWAFLANHQGELKEHQY